MAVVVDKARPWTRQEFSNIPLLVNAAATGASFPWGGGRGAFVVDKGTFSGATVKLQLSIDGQITWVDVGTETTLTAAGGGRFDVPNCFLRAAITGGPPSGIYAYMKPIRTYN